MSELWNEVCVNDEHFTTNASDEVLDGIADTLLGLGIFSISLLREAVMAQGFDCGNIEMRPPTGD